MVEQARRMALGRPYAFCVSAVPLRWPKSAALVASFTCRTVLTPLPLTFAAWRMLQPFRSNLARSRCLARKSAGGNVLPFLRPSLTPLRRASANPLIIRSRRESFSSFQRKAKRLR